MNAKVCLVATCLAAWGCSGDKAAITGDQPDAGGSAGDTDAAPGGEADAAPTELPLCVVPGRAIVSDIDATLTISDNEFLTQLIDPTHDPVERDGGAALINDYAERGYFVLYLTARPEAAPVGLSGQTAADVTLAWLTQHGYPVDPDRTRVALAPGLVFGASAADFKSGVLLDMEDEGFTFDAAYGNATSDIDAYEAAGIAKESTYIIGPEAGTNGTAGVDGEGWVDHTTSVVDPMPSICRWQ